MADWNSALYMKFENERTRAARDLLAQIPEFEPDRIFDLGCGPGNGTQLPTTAFPGATIVGLDLSDNNYNFVATPKGNLGDLLAAGKCRVLNPTHLFYVPGLGEESRRPQAKAFYLKISVDC